MGMYLDLWDVSEGHMEARNELEHYRKITAAAVAVVKNPAWAGVSDEDVILELTLKEAGELDT
jgi:hypothetical protein